MRLPTAILGSLLVLTACGCSGEDETTPPFRPTAGSLDDVAQALDCSTTEPDLGVGEETYECRYAERADGALIHLNDFGDEDPRQVLRRGAGRAPVGGGRLPAVWPGGRAG